MKFRFINNAPEVLGALSAAERRALEKIGLFVEGEAKDNSPVDTGNLRNSITYEIEGKYAVIGTPVEYSPHVELGTSRSRAQPFLRPAVEENQSTIKQIIVDELKNT